ncbi:hypothetical protein MHBO_002356 [Bonamia ostreae]|uniref:Uncharacterized protein n=1 Tax=Bonamia ostreae TaxID=126728 RepID=A0ABV2AM21_9EUKA
MKCISHIRISNPRVRDDGSHRCECLRKKITDPKMKEDNLKAIKNFKDHLRAAKLERLSYRKSVYDVADEMAW